MKKTMLLIALAATLPALHTFAQPDGGNQGPGGNQNGGGQRRPMPPILKALDANGDGVIDAAEIANASKALLTLDKNGDGKLTADELRPQRPGGPGAGDKGTDSNRPPRPDGDKQGGQGPGGSGGHRPMMPLMKALDANGDGTLDADEIANASKALLTLDKNGDGKLTRDELRPQRPDGDKGPSGGKPSDDKQ